MAEMTVRDFVTKVGMEALCDWVGVKPGMIRHAARQGVMPARWYAQATALADVKGVDAPMYLFDMKRSDGQTDT